MLNDVPTKLHRICGEGSGSNYEMKIGIFPVYVDLLLKVCLTPTKRKQSGNYQHHSAVDGMESDADRPAAFKRAMRQNVLQGNLQNWQRCEQHAAAAGGSIGNGKTSHWKMLTQVL